MLARPITLDGWYKHVNQVYLFKNYHRSVEAIYMHFMEIVGGLSLIASGKRKEGVTPEQYLPKAVAWWFALCGKVGIRSVEEMVWAKFPYVCPYCHSAPHNESICKQKNKDARQLDWAKLAKLGIENSGKRPQKIGEWQLMFEAIYPKTESTRPQNFSRLSEEAGELAEGVRVLPVTERYFLVEATDVFAWLMGMVNQYEYDCDREIKDLGPWLEGSLWASYPGKCSQCGYTICRCPPVLESTLGRIAHEIPPESMKLLPGGPLFTMNEALQFFRIGVDEIKIADSSLTVTAELLKQIRDSIDKAYQQLNQVKQGNVSLHMELAYVLRDLEELASREQITQEAIDELVRTLKKMPSPTLQVIIAGLTGLASNMFANMLAKAIGS